MTKTTVYLDTELALALRQLSVLEARPQAELIREALAAYAKRQREPQIPGLGEFDSGVTSTSQDAEKLLKRSSQAGKWRRSKSLGGRR
jgi:predicted transcriptional regulator